MSTRWRAWLVATRLGHALGPWTACGAMQRATCQECGATVYGTRDALGGTALMVHCRRTLPGYQPVAPARPAQEGTP